MHKHFKVTVAFTLLAALSIHTASGSSAETSTRLQSQNSVATEDQEWKDAKRDRTVPIKLYLPPASIAGPCPILIFSHGLGGSREAAAYLGQYLAQKGYVCVHLQHPGSDTEVAKTALRAGRENFRSALGTAATGPNLILRVQDVSFAIDELERRNKSDPLLKNRLDLSKIAVAGHSFGAGTSLAICGQNYGMNGQSRTVTDPRVKAGIYLSAPVNLRGRSLSEVYGQVKVPGLLMTGTNDSSPIGDTKAADRRIPFDGISAPHQYLVNYIDGDHAIFGGRSFRGVRPNDEAFHKSINQVCGAFLDAYLRNDKEAQAWLDGDGAQRNLATIAKYERK